MCHRFIDLYTTYDLIIYIFWASVSEPHLIVLTVNYLHMQYNAHTKCLHPDTCICKHCVRGAAGALYMQPL